MLPPIDPRVADELAKMNRRFDDLNKKVDTMNRDRDVFENIQGRLTSMEQQMQLTREHDRGVAQDIKAEVNVTADEVKDKVAEIKQAIENKPRIYVKATKEWWQRIFHKWLEF